MQKLPAAEIAKAVSVLKSALPPDAKVRPDSPDTASGVYWIETVETRPFAIQFISEHDVGSFAEEWTASGQEPLPVLVLRGRKPPDWEDLRRRAKGFIDLRGAVHLRAPGFYLDRTDVPAAPKSQADRAGFDPYTDKASRVVRALLTRSTARRWSTQGLATYAEVDTSTASRTIRELRDRDLVRDEAPGQGRRSQIWVPEPEALLKDWIRTYRWSDNAQLSVAAPIGSPRRFMKRLPSALPGERWAFSLQAGASLIAPHAEFEDVHVYVEAESLEEFALERGWEPSRSGRLYLMAPVYRESVWYQRQTMENQPVVNPLQLVLDLWHYPVRGREQAEHLLETVLRPTWEAPQDEQ